MGEISEQERLTFKDSNSVGQLLWAESVLAHYLDRQQAMAEERIFGLVDSPEATGTYLANNAIARVEQVRRTKGTCTLACRNGSVCRNGLKLQKGRRCRKGQCIVASKEMGRWYCIGTSTLA